MKDAYREDGTDKQKLCGVQCGLSNGRLIGGSFILPLRVGRCQLLAQSGHSNRSR
jgi:hypothetical protein